MAIQNNVQKVRARIEETSARAAQKKQVKLIGVTKSVSTDIARQLLEEGVEALGENRPEGLLEKQKEIGRDACEWHFIGSLQTRKVRQVINAIDYLHSLDRIGLAEEIEKRANEPVKCFVQVNVSGEESKHGIHPEDIHSFLHEVGQYPKVQVVGLMTMAPLTDDEQTIREVFRSLRQLRDEVQERHYAHAPCTELSMGMSGDFETAIEEGATFVRIGTVLVEA
ncbi:YggS family pyridoxal phosphate-dependent enzyme [Exiguobacterium flavidum]|uniref:YggS family pyridoxal phosphate-dependent enzyme n=1 Tax=Exiguobacterium flavidum TaxID=2184695 RepID=UPI000DF7324D|nr:YggS family pyridoxal phosphate-dependent enzyme [Exiguobacterium flavidum]